MPFAVLYMRQPFKLDFLWAGLCLLGAVVLHVPVVSGGEAVEADGRRKFSAAGPSPWSNRPRACLSLNPCLTRARLGARWSGADRLRGHRGATIGWLEGESGHRSRRNRAAAEVQLRRIACRARTPCRIPSRRRRLSCALRVSGARGGAKSSSSFAKMFTADHPDLLSIFDSKSSRKIPRPSPARRR